MIWKKIRLAALLLLLLTGISVNAQKSTTFLVSTPEAEGVSAKDISSFLDAAGKSNTEFHSFMFLRHGKLIAEGWWSPYRPDLKHTLYSVSKSFTSTAVGFAVSEGRLKVTDKVISFFPKNLLPDTISPYLAQLTIKNLLTMSVGQDPVPDLDMVKGDNWVKAALAVPIKNQPGTKFLYNSVGPYLLSAIVQKLTGQKMIDYLKPRLFKPLGIEGADWEVSPEGINTAAYGLRVKTEDMAKLGQLYLQKGVWKGLQLLPKEWIEEATTTEIEQAPPGTPQSKIDSSDWLQGYGYFFWRCRHHMYRADGAFGQYIIVMPDQDAVVVITAEISNMQNEINLVWKYLLPGIHNDKLPADRNGDAMLNQKLASLALPVPAKSIGSPLQTQIEGKVFKIEPNKMNIDNIGFQFKDEMCTVTLKTDTANYKMSFGSGKWEAGATAMHGPYLVAAAKGNLTGLPPFKIDGAYTWKDEHTLALTLRYIESPHTETITCHFDQNKVLVEIQNSFQPAEKQGLKGELTE
jgi:Beta-lactamase